MRLWQDAADDKDLSDSTWRKTRRSKFGRRLELDSTCRRLAGVRAEVGGCTKKREYVRKSPSEVGWCTKTLFQQRL